MLKFTNSYINLGEEFYQRAMPQKVLSPELLLWNSELASQLLISAELQNNTELLSQYFSGNLLLDKENVIALAYSGHQFGHFNPSLGDGRAHLLGELADTNGVFRDVQLKGSGQTPFSRRGDGKCALGPALREYIMSEALHALGVPTSRCLAVVATGELINRGLAKPGAVVTRVASSHIRVGSFQYFAARDDKKALTKLLDYAIERHFPDINTEKSINKPLSQEQGILLFLEHVIDKQITLIIEWLRIGFIHGVMNTDNTAICGETIDFGPCAMMGAYDEKTVFSSIDEYGRYAFGNQGKIAQWNMARLADCLLLLLTTDDDESANDISETNVFKNIEKVIHQFPEKFKDAYYAMYANKLGMSKVYDDTPKLVDDLLAIMQSNSLDYTQTFHFLTLSLANNRKIEKLDKALDTWFDLWQLQLKSQSVSLASALAIMKQKNPVVIPRNHHVEALLDRCELIVSNENSQESVRISTVVAELVDEFLDVLRTPYQETIKTKNYQDTPEDKDKYYQTYCGT